MKKNKTYIILIVIICMITIMMAITNKENNSEDAKRFAKEYTQVSEDNKFIYTTAEKIIEILQKGTGIIYLGFPECPWCQAYSVYLNEVAKETKTKKIYYCNTKELKNNNKENYDKIINLIKEYLPYKVDEKKTILYVPNVTIVKNGKIIGNENTTAKDIGNATKPEEFWDNQKVLKLKETLKTYIKEIKQ